LGHKDKKEWQPATGRQRRLRQRLQSMWRQSVAFCVTERGLCGVVTADAARHARRWLKPTAHERRLPLQPALHIVVRRSANTHAQGTHALLAAARAHARAATRQRQRALPAPTPRPDLPAAVVCARHAQPGSRGVKCR
jgi:hypothetical protein